MGKNTKGERALRTMLQFKVIHESTIDDIVDAVRPYLKEEEELEREFRPPFQVFRIKDNGYGVYDSELRDIATSVTCDRAERIRDCLNEKYPVKEKPFHWIEGKCVNDHGTIIDDTGEKIELNNQLLTFLCGAINKARGYE